jgi:uncharacterized membrane protein YjjB (DUF3815 family)
MGVQAAFWYMRGDFRMIAFPIGFFSGVLGAVVVIVLFWQFIMPRLLGKMVAASVVGIMSAIVRQRNEKPAQSQTVDKIHSNEPIHMGKGEFFRIPNQESPV